MTIGLQICLPPRPDVAASYALRVPQAGDLPAASFGPRLTAVALAVQLTVPVIRVRRGLSPPSYLVKYHIQPRCINPLHAMPGMHRVGGGVTPAVLPHHLAYGSVPRRFLPSHSGSALLPVFL